MFLNLYSSNQSVLQVILVMSAMTTVLVTGKSNNRTTFISSTNAGETDPNKVLSEFIWSKIISTSQSESPLSASSILSALNHATSATASSPMAPIEGPPPKALLKLAQKVIASSNTPRFNIKPNNSNQKPSINTNSGLAMSSSMQQPRIDSRLIRRSSLLEAPTENQFNEPQQEFSQSFEYDPNPPPTSIENNYNERYQKPLNQIKKLKQSNKKSENTIKSMSSSYFSFGQQQRQQQYPQQEKQPQPKQQQHQRQYQQQQEKQSRMGHQMESSSTKSSPFAYTGFASGRNYFGSMQSSLTSGEKNSMFDQWSMSSYKNNNDNNGNNNNNNNDNNNNRDNNNNNNNNFGNQEQVPEYNSITETQFENNPIVKGKRTLEIAPMIGGKQADYSMEPQIIEVGPDDQPIQVVFRSTSTRVKVQQIHTPTKQEEAETIRTEEEPHRVIHQLVSLQVGMILLITL